MTTSPPDLEERVRRLEQLAPLLPAALARWRAWCARHPRLVSAARRVAR